MKKRQITIVFFIFVCLTISKAQINVNREWQESSGTPFVNPLSSITSLGWTASVTDGAGNIFTVGHTAVTSQGENLYLSKRDPSGALIFERNKNTTGSNNDYATAIALDGSGNIIVCGATDNGGTTNYDALLYVFNSSGTDLDSIVYSGSSGLNDIATDVKIEPSGYILMLCAGESASSGYDYIIQKYSTSLSLSWSSSYGNINLTDVPLGIDIDGSDVNITGASASGLLEWDYAVARFNLSSGSYISDTRTSLPGIGYSQPLAFKKDALSNVYITGKGSTNGTDFNIFTVKINPSYSIAWTRTVDVANGEDVGNALDIDNSGNIFVGGYTTKSSNVKQITILKYDSTGTLLWQHYQNSKDENADAFVKDLCVTPAGDAYFIAGETGTSGYKEVIVGKISGANDIIWEKSIKSNDNHVPSSIILNSDGTLYACSIKNGSTPEYLTTKYSELALDTNRIFTGGNAVCKQNELIVRFNVSALNTSVIDNTTGTKIAEYGNLGDFMNSTPYSTLSSALTEFCHAEDIKVVKIFSDMKTTYTITTSRLGQTIPVPDFWTALLLVFPAGTNIKYVQDVLNTIPSIVSYVHPNYIAKFDNGANDPLYPFQYHLNNNLNIYPGTDINVQEAWDIIPSGGLPFIKGGVFDTGIIWAHEDFAYTGFPNSSKIIDGWNFQNNTALKTGVGEGPTTTHGTGVAGIIGAVRNNGKGVAGVAGGNYTMSPNPNKGVSLYSLRIGDGNGLFFTTINYIASAIVSSASSNTNISQYSYGLNFQNHSWGLQPWFPPIFTDTNITLLNDAVHHANRTHVTVIAARGNDSLNIPAYPALSDDDWVLTVGAYGTDGTRCTPMNNCSYYTTYGGLDVCAPGSNLLIVTTENNNGNPSAYQTFGMTSGAAPHVSGSVGLLMSYMNDTLRPYMNLAPEDCEELIQRSATDVSPGGYDSLTGYGRLNIGKALRLVEKPYRKLWHFSSDSTSNVVTKSVYSSSDTIKLVEAYQDQNYPPNNYTRRRYVVKTYEIDATFSHSIPSTDTIKGYWSRPSSSEVLQLFNPLTKKLYARQRPQIVSCNNSSAVLKGYIYQVKDTLGSSLGWWPCDTTFSCQNIKSLFAYSVLTRNNIPYVGIAKNVLHGNNISLFPNPTSGRQEFFIETNRQQKLTIDLYDLMGRYLKTIYSGNVQAGEMHLNTDVTNLPNSMYLYNIKLGDEVMNKKFIKQ